MSSLNTKPRLTRLGHKGWNNLWLCANIKILVLRITRTDPWSNKLLDAISEYLANWDAG